ncbi:SDR family NAD(P)-dependent oxidoreductase [Planococcus shenhongbingii]|uniref:SDR family NAD(P)-dependent oxidoreductase n=1 Tax=Planococcus shenhongbingii TaxID=3058398 RepID=A0ABT8NB67_9BACL|nr:SDR family NAD(P)-dependent oxidoreductase [Planococcus sp. N017]MDN7245139.1 SDR family NAD(P)-dependent oxidoreductase [Planococcus sp. N017]
MTRKKSRQGLTIVITGASSGFGKGVAQKLAAQGANVVLAARRTDLIEELAAECGPNATAVTTDISDEKEMVELMETALSKFGTVDVWFNNAGLGILGSFTDTPLKDLNRLVDINMIGTMYGSHLALRQFKSQGYGTLINMSSFVSKVPLPFGAAYTATKFGITGMSAGLYQEMELEKRSDIHVCTVHPWVTDTPWVEHLANYSGHEIILGPVDDPEKVIEVIIGLIDKPQPNVDVGFKSKTAVASYELMPKVVEYLNGRSLLAMLRSAPQAERTSGSLHEPKRIGTGVSGRMRERLKKKLKDEEK